MNTKYDYLKAQFEAECEELRMAGVAITYVNFEIYGFNPAQYPAWFW